MSISDALRRAAAAVLLAVVLAACGSPAAQPPPQTAASDPASPASAPSEHAAAFPVTVGSGAAAVTLPERPKAIVSLSPTATETLFAIGAGDQVVAVDDQSDYPPDVPTTALSAYEPNVEAIINYEPDLVVASGDEKLGKGLAAAGIPLLVQPAATTLKEAYRQIEQLGAATGRAGAATKLVTQMQRRIAQIADSVPNSLSGTTYFHELDTNYYSVTSSTFIGQLYALLGLESIANAASGAGDYPKLSPEYIVEADPDVIFLADSECCGIKAADVAERPGWRHIAAVKSSAILELDEDTASRWGPRIVDHLTAVADLLNDLPAAQAGSGE